MRGNPPLFNRSMKPFASSYGERLRLSEMLPALVTRGVRSVGQHKLVDRAMIDVPTAVARPATATAPVMISIISSDRIPPDHYCPIGSRTSLP